MKKFLGYALFAILIIAYAVFLIYSAIDTVSDAAYNISDWFHSPERKMDTLAVLCLIGVTALTFWIIHKIDGYFAEKHFTLSLFISVVVGLIFITIFFL
ncbi:MAG: hypothetical protein J6B99_06940 [Oscillospiraceae bacterium]|nr:hypothetical protein [Oscillospiraceae bacterium]